MKSARSTSALPVQLGGGGATLTRQTADGAATASHTRTTSSSVTTLSRRQVLRLASLPPHLSTLHASHEPEGSQEEKSKCFCLQGGDGVQLGRCCGRECGPLLCECFLGWKVKITAQGLSILLEWGLCICNGRDALIRGSSVYVGNSMMLMYGYTFYLFVHDFSRVFVT